MKESLTVPSAEAFTEQIIRQLINAWTAQNKIITGLFNKYDEEVYLEEVAPGRNRAIYILGHLTAASDNMLPLFGLGEKLYPRLEALFSSSPDRTFAELPSVAELRGYWTAINSTLSDHFSKMQPADWLSRHTKVSEADFALDPLRNKLNVLISRTNHQSYHSGQLTFLKQKETVSTAF